MIKLIVLLIFVTLCYSPFFKYGAGLHNFNEYPRMFFLCQVHIYIYIHVSVFSISWYLNANVI